MIAIMFLAVHPRSAGARAAQRRAGGVRSSSLLFPESLLDVGFQMSFAAVVALIAAYEALSGPSATATFRGQGRSLWRVSLFLGGIVLSTLIASVAVAPFAAYHFHQSQQYAVLANLIAIPICNLLVMPAALARAGR